MTLALQGAAYALTWISITMTTFIIVYPEWRINDVEGEIVEVIRRTQGLWIKCAWFPAGNYQCEDFDIFFIDLPKAIIGARVCCILTLIILVISAILQPLGMECTKMPEMSAKRTLVFICAVASFVACVLLATGVSWYASLVVQDYDENRNR